MEMSRLWAEAYGIQNLPPKELRAAMTKLTVEQRRAALEKRAEHEEHMRQWRKRYAFEAYQCMRKAMKKASAEGAKRDASKALLPEATRQLAIEEFGLTAKKTLQDWNVTNCADLAEIHVRLIAEESPRNRPTHPINEFTPGFDFNEAFPEN